MKSLIARGLLVVLLLSPVILFAQNRFEHYAGLDPSRVTTGILYDIAHPHSGIDQYTGRGEIKALTPAAWRQAYFELYQASYDKSGWPEVPALRGKNRLFHRDHIYPIAVIDVNYEKIREDALEKGLITLSDDRFQDVAGTNPYEVRNAFLAAVLSKRTYTSVVTFVLDPDFIFINHDREIDHFLVDFDDGAGLQTLSIGESYQTTYAGDGIKTLRLKAVYADGSEKASAFTLEVKDVKMPEPDIEFDDPLNPFIADIPYLDTLAKGDVAVFFGKDNTAITDPVILVDGFDPGDLRPMEELYELANQKNMVDSIRSLGMDAILLNFIGGADHIQRNAFLFVKLVQWVNQQMTDAGTMQPANQIVVIGPSMGGLITRYGITYMESQGIPHNIRSWISFDSPQKGANIPLGLQHWVRFFADEAGSEGAVLAKEALQSPAARQQLLYHYERTSGTKANPHEWLGTFYGELNTLGYPQIRKVSVINGSGYGNNQGFGPGDQVINYDFYQSGFTTIELRGDAWAIPSLSQGATKIFDGLYYTAIFYIIPIDNVSETRTVDNTLPLDGAPGGQRNVFEELAAIDPGYGDIIAYYSNCSFIPVISSLALGNTTDPYFNVHAYLGEVVTPFDKIYYPFNNEDHNIITDTSFVWFKHEVYNFPPVITSTPPTRVFHDSLYTYTLAATDVNEWNILAYEAENLPEWLSLNGNVLSGTPDFYDAGTYSISLKVSDGLKEALQEFTIEVIPLYVFSGTGDWEDLPRWNTPVLPAETSIVRVNGSATITTDITVADLSIDESRSLTIGSDGSLTVSGPLVNEAGTSGLIVESGGSLIQHNAGVPATARRSIQAANWSDGTDGWHLLSSPVDNQAITGEWIPTGSGNDYDFFAWGESEQMWLNQKLPENNITHFIPGQGYLVAYQQAGTRTFSGNLNVDNVTQGLSRTIDTPHSGWNLLGNPYPSALLWNNAIESWGDLELLQINSHAQIWNRIAKSYTIIPPGGVIPALNGFMVQLTGGTTGSLTIPSAERVHNGQPWYKSTDEQWIKLVVYEQADASFQESNILINPATTAEYHPYYDARFLSGYAPLFYGMKGDEYLSVYSLPAIHDEVVISLGFIKNSGSSFRLELAQTIPGLPLYLVDLKLNAEHPLGGESPYAFTSAPGDDPLRFELRFSPGNTTGFQTPEDPLVSIHSWDNTLYLSFAGEAEGRLLQVYDTAGRLVMNERLDHGLNHARQLNLQAGVYLVRVSSPGGVSTQRVFVK